MESRTSRGRNARLLKGLSLLLLGLSFAALLLVHGESYKPAVSYVLLYFTFSIIFTAAVALLLLPARAFGEGLCAFFYLLYAACFSAAAFFTGGISSELYIAFFPLIFAGGMHGTWRIGLPSLLAVLVSYPLAMLPDVLEDIGGSDGPALLFFRVAAFALVGAFALATGAWGTVGLEEGYDEVVRGAPVAGGDGSLLLEKVSGELAARRGRGSRVGVVLVDPGGPYEGADLLVGRLRGRVGEPIPLDGDGSFGLVLPGAGAREAEEAARLALAAALFLGAREARAGAAVYPRDASSAQDLLAAAGGALDAAFSLGEPGAVFLAGRGPDGAEPSYKAAR